MQGRWFGGGRLSSNSYSPSPLLRLGFDCAQPTAQAAEGEVLCLQAAKGMKKMGACYGSCLNPDSQNLRIRRMGRTILEILEILIQTLKTG